jgi:hypothetical protein
MRWLRIIAAAALIAALYPQAALAQDAGGAQAGQPEDDPDRDLNLAQPDFTLVNLPTTLRLPRFKSAFRVTHRFGRPFGAGDFGDLAGDLFGLDSGAQIGLEYRFGLIRGGQIGIHRTSNKTIEFFGQYSVLQQKDNNTLSLDASLTIEGLDNFSESYSPSIGIVVSREYKDWLAIYAEPRWVNNSNPLPTELVDDNDTFFLGFGGRIRVRPTVYIVGEFIPRLGFEPGVNHGTFGVEKRAGGHVFQLNFSNGFGTTMGQLARGGTGSEDWYLGFNISRKFF